MVSQRRVGGYARLSLQGEDEESIKRQLQDGRKWAELNDYIFVEYVEPAGARSGYYEKRRPSYRQLKADIRSGLLQAVWFADLARASRSLIELFALIDLCQKNKIVFVSQKENLDPETAIGKAMLGVIAVFNEWYRNDISERQTRRVSSRKANKETVGKIPLGLLRNSKKKFEPSMDAYVYGEGKRRYIETIIRFLQLYQHGDSGATQLADELNLEGFRWAKTYRKKDENGNVITIREPIPVDEHNISWTIRIMESYRGSVPDDLLERCLVIKRKRARRSWNGNKREQEPPLLWRILFCPECGLRYAMDTGVIRYKNKNGVKLHPYKRYAHRGVLCSQSKRQITYMAKKVDIQMLQVIMWALGRSDQEKDAIARAMSTPTIPDKPTVDVGEVKARLERLKNLYVIGAKTLDEYKKESEELNELLILPEQVPMCMTYEQARKEVEELPAALLYEAETNPTRANQIIRLLIDRVEMVDGQITSFTPNQRYFALFSEHPLCVKL